MGPSGEIQLFRGFFSEMIRKKIKEKGKCSKVKKLFSFMKYFR
jgi:hypothetical protein